jgi:histidyl-tRNA synthetase
MEIKTPQTVKGTRILFGEIAFKKSLIISDLKNFFYPKGFNEMYLPILQFQETFENKVGVENNNMMYTFTDQGNRRLCLAPEYTAIVQELSQNYFKMQRDVKLFYVVECFRGEKPQAGRYRQFTQFGIEIINPRRPEIALDNLVELATNCLDNYKQEFQVNRDVTRGLDYYKEGKGFEISCETLGAQKQICGGGIYDGGVGFAFGVDRLLLLK